MTALAAFLLTVSLCLYSLSVYGNNVLSNTWYYFCQFISFLATVKLLQVPGYYETKLIISFYCYAWSQPQRKSNFRKLWDTDYKEGHCTTQKQLFSWILYCTNFPTKSRAGMNYHVAKNNSKAIAGVAHECKICDKSFKAFTCCENVSRMNM